MTPDVGRGREDPIAAMVTEEVSLEFTPAIPADACTLGMRCGMSRVDAPLHYIVHSNYVHLRSRRLRGDGTMSKRDGRPSGGPPQAPGAT